MESSAARLATEHAIARWQALSWRRSRECGYLIQVLLSLRVEANCCALKVGEILAHHIPDFFMLDTDDAFFTMLQQEIMSDEDLHMCFTLV